MISDLRVKGGFFFPFFSFPSLLFPSLPRRGAGLAAGLLGLDNAPFYCPPFAFLWLLSLQFVWVLGRL